MKHFLFALFALICSQALAAETVAVKLTVEEALTLHNALSSLDGKSKTITDRDQERTIVEPYTLPPQTRLAVARNLRVARGIVEAYQDARKATIQEFSKPGEKFNEKSPQWQDFSDKIEAMLQEEQTANLVMIKTDDLNLAANAIPGSVLAGLAPVLSDFEVTTPTPEAPAKQ